MLRAALRRWSPGTAGHQAANVIVNNHREQARSHNNQLPTQEKTPNPQANPPTHQDWHRHTTSWHPQQFPLPPGKAESNCTNLPCTRDLREQ